MFVSLADSAPSPDHDVTASEFDAWITSERRAANGVAFDKPTYCNAVIERFDASRAVNESAVMSCTGAWIENALPGLAPDGSSLPSDLAPALNFFSTLVPQLQWRPLLRARVLSRRAEMLSSAGRTEEALADWAAAEKLLEDQRLNVDELRYANLVSYADALLAQGDNGRAAELYQEVLSYPWFNAISRPESFQKLRQLYVRAGFGLIKCREGDIDALDEIYFVPATEDELGPVLAEAKSMARQVSDGQP